MASPGARPTALHAATAGQLSHRTARPPALPSAGLWSPAVPAVVVLSRTLATPHQRLAVSGQPSPTSGIIEGVTSAGLEHLARTAYEAHRGAHPGSLPPWEDSSEQEQQAWKVAVSAVAGQTGITLADAAPAQSLLLQAGDQQHTFHAGFTAGRLGALVISDDFASTQHARFQAAHGLWYVEDLDSKNGTWLNGRRIHAPQRLKKGDKIKIGHTVVTVIST